MVGRGAPRPGVRGRPFHASGLSQLGLHGLLQSHRQLPALLFPGPRSASEAGPPDLPAPSGLWSPALTKETRVEGAQSSDLERGVLWGQTGPSLLGVLCGDPSHVQDGEDRGLSETCKWTQSRPASCRAWERWWPIPLGHRWAMESRLPLLLSPTLSHPRGLLALIPFS